MKVHAFTDQVAIYDLSGTNEVATRIDVIKGVPVIIVLEDYSNERVFADMDPVLELDHKPNTAQFKITPKEIGQSEVQIQDRTNKATVRFIVFTIVDSISLPAATLGLTLENKRPKELTPPVE